MNRNFTLALRNWCAKREGVEPSKIMNAELSYSPGFGGGDVTPPEKEEITITYSVIVDRRVEVEMSDIPRLISEIADIGAREITAPRYSED